MDSRWVAVTTLRGTTHVFPIAVYGGECVCTVCVPLVELIMTVAIVSLQGNVKCQVNLYSAIQSEDSEALAPGKLVGEITPGELICEITYKQNNSKSLLEFWKVKTESQYSTSSDKLLAHHR